MQYKSILFETDDFFVAVPNPPHIDRIDGGHIVVVSKCLYDSFTDMPFGQSCEMLKIARFCGDALKHTLVKDGIDIGIINYQINGNWSALSMDKDPIHMHIYGRAINSVHQKYGEALYFPNPENGFYEKFMPINDDEIEWISLYLKRKMED